jgi:hypothetical protein
MIGSQQKTRTESDDLREATRTAVEALTRSESSICAR